LEEWKDIEGYEGFYQVSNLGRIRSLDRISGGKRYSGKILSGRGNGKYVVDVLCKDGKRQTVRRHRIVAEAFIPNPHNKPEVNHLDGNKENNATNNLEWSTKKENTDHSWKQGLTKCPPSENPKAVIQMTLDGNFFREFDSIKLAAETMNICSGDICRCCMRKRKSAGGYQWRYKEENTYGN
jgi:hypothetical protein